jgi:hypothetical protein
VREGIIVKISLLSSVGKPFKKQMQLIHKLLHHSAMTRYLTATLASPKSASEYARRRRVFASRLAEFTVNVDCFA